MGLAELVMERIDALAAISDEPARLTRTFCSPAMRRVNGLVGSWMRGAGMAVREDALGNLIGQYPGHSPKSAAQGAKPLPKSGEKIFLLGSHLDTVRDAGKFDGPLGVLIAIACVEHLRENGICLPFDIEIAGFADEEGVRYQSTYLGSKALAGTFDPEDLKRTDSRGITMAEAVRNFGGDPDALASARLDRSRLVGYAEVHIEQGPVLEQRNLAVGVVTAIAGQSRAKVGFTGMAGHAGTVPMNLRRDALCAAAEFILAVESLAQSRGGLVATVGEVCALPGATNVIPGEASLSIDLRHPEDAVRKSAWSELEERAKRIAKERDVELTWRLTHETAGVVCDRSFSGLLSEAVKRRLPEVVLMHSGAGHDAAALAAITGVAMLFVRCKGGISHHPAESASLDDVRVAIEVMNDFLESLARSL